MPSNSWRSGFDVESTWIRQRCSYLCGIWWSIWRGRDISTSKGSLSKLPLKGHYCHKGRTSTIFSVFFSHGCIRLHSLWWKWCFCYQQQWKHGKDISWAKVCCCFDNEYISITVMVLANLLVLSAGDTLDINLPFGQMPRNYGVYS